MTDTTASAADPARTRSGFFSFFSSFLSHLVLFLVSPRLGRLRCLALALSALACVGVASAGSSEILLRYDEPKVGKGYLSGFDDSSGSTEYTRDGFGAVTSKEQTLANGLRQIVRYDYGRAHLLDKLTYPNGMVLGHVYDHTGLLTDLTLDGAPFISDIRWNALGQPVAWTWAFVTPRLTGTRVYNTAGQLARTEFSAFGYDRAGRIDAIVQQLFRPGDSDPTHDSIVRVATISRVRYDAVGRIVHFETANNEGSIWDYSYDANGNRTASSRTLAGLTTTRNYQLAVGRNRPEGFTQTQGAATSEVVYGYDANGALTSDGLRRFTYNREGRLAAVTVGAGSEAPTTRYAHNALGQRVFKTETVYPAAAAIEAPDKGWMQGLVDLFAQLVPSAATDADKLGTAYLYDERGSLLSETGTGGPNSTGSTHYVYLRTANGPLPIAAIVNGQKFAVHSDHLNTPRRITNDQGQPVWQWAYSPFGETKPTTAHHRFADLEATPNPGTANSSELVVNKRFDGMYFDAESGLFANWHRYYDPRTGRYTQGDPIGLGGGLNRSTFGAGNPLSNSDPNGLQVMPTPLGPIPIPLPPATPGSPASIDPENPYGRGAPPSLQIPWNPLTMIPKAIVAGCTALTDWMFSRGKTLGDVLTPNGQPVGEKAGAAGPGVRTVTPDQLDGIIDGLKGLGTTPGSRVNYPGDWYDLPNNQGGFGIRESRGSGRTVDVNIPGVPDVTKIHQKP